jgi:peptidyl-prolyl cis-trans isomerase-like protein 2
MLDVVIFVDPFEEFLSQKRDADSFEVTKRAKARNGETDEGNDDDQSMTWTGKRLRGFGSGGAAMQDSGGSSGVGKYLKAPGAATPSSFKPDDEDEIVELVDEEDEPEHVRKKMKSVGRGGFGNFDAW